MLFLILNTTKTVEKPFVTICWGFGCFSRKLTRLVFIFGMKIDLPSFSTFKVFRK